MFSSLAKRLLPENLMLYAVIALGLGTIYSIPAVMVYSDKLFAGSDSRHAMALVTGFAGEYPRNMYNSYQGDAAEYVSAVNASLLGEHAVNLISESPTVLVHQSDESSSRLTLVFHPDGIVVRTVITPQRQFVHFAQYELLNGLVVFSPLFVRQRAPYVEKAINHWPTAVAAVADGDSIRLINPAGSGLIFKHQD